MLLILQRTKYKTMNRTFNPALIMQAEKEGVSTYERVYLKGRSDMIEEFIFYIEQTIIINKEHEGGDALGRLICIKSALIEELRKCP